MLVEYGHAVIFCCLVFKGLKPLGDAVLVHRLSYLFVHIFTHREHAYPFEARDETDWMARNFFTGGVMPSDHTLLYFQRDLQVQAHWRVNGRHYQATANAWLERLDASKEPVLALFRTTYGADQALRRFVQWRVFFMACAELFGSGSGESWMVSHYLFEKP